METVVSKVGTQPGLSVTNEEIAEQFPAMVVVPEGKTSGPVFYAAIGAEYEGNDGKPYVPVTLVQARNDLYQSSRTESNSFFRGWEGFENIVRHTENIPPERMKEIGVELGKTVPGAGIFVDYSVESFFNKSDGTKQDPVMNPSTEMFLVVEGNPLYRNTRIQFNENQQHSGINLRNKAVEVSEADLDSLDPEETRVFSL